MIPILLAALLLGSPTTKEADVNPTGAFDMARYRWMNRPLLLFAPIGDDPRLIEQRRVLDDAKAGLIDRDMIVIEMVGSDTGHARDPADGSDERLVAEDVRQLRLAYDVPIGDFALILVGKDGTEKRRKSEPTEVAPIFGQIDQMPMRRDEMRHEE